MGQLQFYCSEYPTKCDFAVDFYSENKKIIDDIVDDYGYDARFIYSLVAPEVANFSDFEEEWQTTAMEVLYIDYGVSYANFSVGQFQLKMSFVESLENEVLLNKKLSAFNYIIYYQATEEQEIRAERLKRMQDYKWQLKYLCLFYAVMEIRHNNMYFTSIEEKLKFYSTAFNHSYKVDKSEIFKWQKIAFFPKGLINSNYIYCEVCIEFYNKLYKE